MTDSALPQGLTPRQEREMMGWLRDRQGAAELARNHPNQAALHHQTVALYDRLLNQFGISQPDAAFAELNERLRQREETARTVATAPTPPTLISGIGRLLGATPAAAATLPEHMRASAAPVAAVQPDPVTATAVTEQAAPTASAPTPQPVALNHAIQRVRFGGLIMRGHQGDEVRQVQEALHQALGDHWRDSRGRPLSRDSQFGPQTVEAVRAFQRSQNLDPDGKIGRFTLTALGRASGHERIADELAPPSVPGRRQVSGGVDAMEPATPHTPVAAVAERAESPIV